MPTKKFRLCDSSVIINYCKTILTLDIGETTNYLRYISHLIQSMLNRCLGPCFLLLWSKTYIVDLDEEGFIGTSRLLLE